VAQDFLAAFGLNGTDDKHISVVDEGIAALSLGLCSSGFSSLGNPKSQK
jgi:hypothetical protein